jgi:gamma-glutamyltranspeptidase
MDTYAGQLVRREAAQLLPPILQVILNVLEYAMDAGAAVSASRIHHQWLPEELRIDSDRSK